MEELFTESSAFLVLINLLMVFIISRVTRVSLHPPYVINYNKRHFVVILILLFVLFSFWGPDWFHYRDGYMNLRSGEVGHMEDIYGWIAKYLSFNYISFRLVIWGSALYLLNAAIKKLPIKYDIALFLFGSIWLIWFSYARVSLAMSCVFLSLILFLDSNKNKKNLFTSIILLVISVFFHKTAMFGIFCIVVAYSVNRLSKYVTLLLFTIAFLYLYLNINSFLNDFVSLSVDHEDGGFSNNIAVGQYYLSNDQIRNVGIGERIAKFLEHCSYYMTLACCIQFIRKNKREKTPLLINIFISLLIIIVCLSSIFALDFGLHTSVLFIRFIRFAMIPGIIVMAYFVEQGSIPKLTRLTIGISLISTFYALAYAFYCLI